MVLLMMAAGYLTCGLESTAYDLAVYAYYALVVGVVFQLASYLKYEEKDQLLEAKARPGEGQK